MQAATAWKAGGGADIFVLGGGHNRIADFNFAEGDRVLVTFAGALAPGGAVDADIVRLRALDSDLAIEVDADRDGVWRRLATLEGVGAAQLEDILLNAVLL